jgi:hypothetical protein
VVCYYQGTNDPRRCSFDDFILACADRDTLDVFRQGLLARFDGTYEGKVHMHVEGC